MWTVGAAVGPVRGVLEPASHRHQEVLPLKPPALGERRKAIGWRPIKCNAYLLE
jgi:hypothetical protein